ncbi:hypothetical protein ACC772_37900, partial [Rhizobium ruizarguesonis]
GHDASDAMAFFGKYLDVSPPSRLVWTNDESEGAAVTTVTFEIFAEEGHGIRGVVSERDAITAPGANIHLEGK